jgi:hypothetical protein
MTCLEFERWLDDGRPECSRTLEHVATCDPCAHAYRAALELDALLAMAVPVDVDAGFQDAVLQQLQPRPTWIDVAAEPLVPVSIVLAIALGAAHRPLASALEGMQLTAGLAAALAPLLLGASWQLFRLYRRLTLPGL